MEDGGLPEAASTAWDAVVEETEELAGDYRERGWTATAVHPGDVTPVFEESFGLNVLAPGSEYETVRRLVDSHEFDRTHVYRDDGAQTFLLCVFEATADEVAVVVPAYVLDRDLDRLFGRARSEEAMYVHVRPLEYDERATFTVSDYSLFFDTS